MNEHDWADQFTHDVDHLLTAAGRSDVEPRPTEYHQSLRLAETLATTDFSDESEVRRSLRGRLLNQISSGKAKKHLAARTRARPVLQRPLPLALGAALALLLVLGVLYPGRLVAAANSTYRLIQRLVLGQHTTIDQVDFEAFDETVVAVPNDNVNSGAELDDGWSVTTEIGCFGGNVPPGNSPIVQTLASFQEAQEATLFSLQTPAELPAGYLLREIKLAPVGSVFLFYGGPGHDIVLVQESVGRQTGEDPGTVVIAVSQSVTRGSLEEVDLNDRPAAWVDGNTLKWEHSGVSFTLGGADLSLDEAIHMAESLR